MRPLSNVVWNLFLAVIPVILGWGIAYFVRAQGKIAGVVSVGLLMITVGLWLAFLPNTCYLLTEWRHYLTGLCAHPSLYLDARAHSQNLVLFLLVTGFYVLYSGTGMLCFFLALFPIDRIFHLARPVKSIFFLLCSVGVYLGLIPRLNSWDFAGSAAGILSTAVLALVRPNLAMLVIAFALVLWLMYEAFCLMIEGIESRRGRQFFDEQFEDDDCE